jgi:hypothetical protein
MILDEEEGELVYSTDENVLKDKDSEQDEEQPAKEKPTDPRWEALMKLRNN